MEKLHNLATRIRPDLRDESGPARSTGALPVILVMLYAPLALGGLIWLGLATQPTDLPLWAAGILTLIILGLKSFNFMLVTEFGSGVYSTTNASLDAVATWSAVMLFGPIVIWLDLVVLLGGILWQMESTKNARWQAAQQMATSTSVGILSMLAGWQVFTLIDGPFLIAALIASVVVSLVTSVLIMPLFRMFHWVAQVIGGPQRATWRAFLPSLTVSAWAANMAAVPVAFLYQETNVAIYVLFLAMLTGGSFVAHQLSQALERDRQHSRQLEQMVKLGRALIDAAPDGADLGRVLHAHLPGMFSFAAVAVHLFERGDIAAFPTHRVDPRTAMWQWLVTHQHELIVRKGEQPPWDDDADRDIVLLPLRRGETVVGGVVLSQRRGDINANIDALWSLASQIEAALQSAAVYKQAVANEKATQALEFAGRIQRDFLAGIADLDHPPGWDFAVRLEPALETSGDFFDVIPLSERHYGFVIADVADKGIGAALFMALSRTLLRTYALEQATDGLAPHQVFEQANRRMLLDARTNQFVTAVYGVLDVETGVFSYANAGHNPPYLFTVDGPCKLARTGIPLGILDDRTWHCEQITIQPGDALVLYTDGIPEARAIDETFFETERLLEVVAAHREAPAGAIVGQVAKAVHSFAEGAVQSDDLTLVVVKREKQT